MTVPRSFSIPGGIDQILSWTFVSGLNPLIPVNDAVVTATLYFGRDIDDPATNPGSPVANFTNIPLSFVSNGMYQGPITPAFNPTHEAGYVLVVDAVSPTYGHGHWELPAAVITP